MAYNIGIIVGILACVGFLVWYRKKQAGAAPAGKPPQRGIIK